MDSPLRILGISAYYHDSAAALVDNGRIVAAAQEERFTRRKHDSGFPKSAIQYCLAEAGLRLADLDYVVFYDKPFLKFERLLETYTAIAPQGFPSFQKALPVWIKEKLFQRDILRAELQAIDKNFDGSNRLLFSEHHLSHAASAFFPSPFAEAAVLTLDGVGEWATTSLAVGRGNSLTVLKEINFPHSLGLLYSAFTYYAGFKVNSGEYKLMGLAPYGTPRYADLIRDNLIDIKADGSFRLDTAYFGYLGGLRMINKRFERLFGLKARRSEDPVDQRHMDIAASIQAVTEEVMIRLSRSVAAETGQKYLCLAGGVALNCVANGKILRDGRFEDIWIQPAAGDAGGAIGAALAVHHLHANRPRIASHPDAMRGSYLGPEFSQHDIEERLTRAGARWTTLAPERLLSTAVESLANQEALGWFQGRMEFGPRALGARSIVADARSSSMQSVLNLKVKFRESFRPFAPSVLAEDCGDWFELDRSSPYMLLVAKVCDSKRLDLPQDIEQLAGLEKLKLQRSLVPAVTHVDYSARVQTVHEETNPKYHRLLSLFKAKTGCPVLVNTSFNVRGEPIVCTPEDAFHCFMGTEMDTLAIGDSFLRKGEQDPALLQTYQDKFIPD
jgi:carbamoyltransferase